MFRSKTLFIIGAGASSEVGLPLGKDLVDRISETLNFYFDAGHMRSGDGDFYQHLRNRFSKEAVNDHVKAARKIATGLTFANSIDRYLDTHANDETMKVCGKAAIVFEILKAERECAFALDKNTGKELHLSKAGGTWFESFVRILFEGVNIESVGSIFDEISIICFNYDRCIERFLPFAIQSHFGKDLRTAQQITTKLRIFHPYGSLGALPTPDNPNGLEFGYDPVRADIFGISERISTFTEQVENERLLSSVRQEVARADTVVFLGFGFLPDNMRLLKPEFETVIPRVFATAYNESETDREIVKRSVYEMLNPSSVHTAHEIGLDRIKLHNFKCSGLFEEYWRSLQK